VAETLLLTETGHGKTIHGTVTQLADRNFSCVGFDLSLRHDLQWL